MKSVDFKQTLTNIKLQNSFFSRIFSKKIDSFLVIEISDKLVILSVSIKNKLRINAFKSISLTPENRGETILNFLKDFIKQNNIKQKEAILNPGLENMVLKRIKIPAVPDSELADAIRWQLKDDIPFDLSVAIIEYSIIDRTTKEDGSKLLDIICVAAKEEEVKKQVLLLKQLGLNCLAVNISPFGYIKTIDKYLMPKSDEAVAILTIDVSKSYITIYKNNKLEFYRELPLSIDKLKASLKGVFVTEKGRIELSSQEIDEIFSQIGIPQEDSVYKQKISSIQILSLMRPVLERLIIEIKRSFSYYDTEYTSGKVKTTFVTGLGLKIPNLDKFLAKELNLAVENLDLKDKLAASPNINQQDLSEHYGSLGLVFDYGQQINFLPYEFRTKQIENVEKVSLRWVAFIAILLLGVSFFFTKMRIDIAQKNLDNAKFHLSTLSEVKDTIADFNTLNNFIGKMKKTEPPVGIILKKLSNLARQELFFSQLSINCDAKSGSISGFVKTLEQNPDAILTKFISAMKASVYFSDANIVNVSKEDRQGSNISIFNINFKLN